MNPAHLNLSLVSLLTVPIASCIVCILLIVISRPLLQRYALARPNARSSHKVPTPQGGGAAVVTATIIVALCSTFVGAPIDTGIVLVFVAAVALAVVGAFDDLRPIPVLPRLILQAVAAVVILATIPIDIRIAPAASVWLERAILLIGGLWFINLVNFMDGLDWMTVAETIPVTAALVLFGICGQLPAGPTVAALALCGAMIGFAPFNRPIARLFLGDVGSLPIGLLIAWCLLQLAAGGYLIAATLLPLYYLADATITLVRRMARGEAIWTAHRSHFYQRATENGFSVMQVVTEVFALNIFLAVLAAGSIFVKSSYVEMMALAVGMGGVALLLSRFSRPRKTLPG